jgi:hypothetical protein
VAVSHAIVLELAIWDQGVPMMLMSAPLTSINVRVAPHVKTFQGPITVNAQMDSLVTSVRPTSVVTIHVEMGSVSLYLVNITVVVLEQVWKVPAVMCQ